MKYIHYIYFIFLSFIYASDSLSFFDNQIKKHIILDFEPLSISTYMLDRFYPNSFSDYNEYSYTIDGAMRLPIYQNISKKIYFNLSEAGTFSQLSYRQKKSDLFFDTNVAFKTDINDKTDMILKAESKSLDENINQNYVFFINKNDDNQKISFSYMYHIEKTPNIEYYSNFNQNVESFNLGSSYQYESNDYLLKITSSIMTSANKRSGLINDYNLRAYWIDLFFRYDLNEKNNLLFKHKRKKMGLQHFNQNNIFVNDKKYFSYYFSHKMNDNFTTFYGLDILNNKYFPSLSLIYNKNKFKLSLISDNQILNADIHLEEIEGENYISSIPLVNVNNQRIELFFENKNSKNLLGYGEIDANDINYNYWFINGEINNRIISFTYDYHFYNSNIIYLKKYFNFGIMYSPVLSAKKYRPYLKLFGDYIDINNIYDINIENINLFQFDELNIETKDNLTFMNFEIGIIFDEFKISFVRKNPFVEEVMITENMTYIRYDYIDIIWIFKN